MAEIPVSTIVNVTITTTPVAPTRAGFGTLLVVTTSAEAAAATTPLTPTEGVRFYASIDEVAVDFISTTEVYKMANAYFSQSPRPTQIAVGARDVGDATVSDTLTRLESKSADWYFVAFETTTRDGADIDLIAAWCEARIKQFFTTTNDAGSIVAGDQTDELFDLNASGYERTFVMYSSTVAEYPECAACAIAATVNFNQPDSTITLKFQDLAGITPETITSGQLSALVGKGGNALTVVGGVRILQEGIMVKGVGTWQDTIHGVDWLQNAIETNVFGRLVTAGTKVPLTDKGAQQLANEVTKALEEGVKNGLIAPGETADDRFLQTGYEVIVGKVADMPLADKQQRKSPPISFTAIGAGAIHSVEIQGVFEG
jgi:hypothetical protein